MGRRVGSCRTLCPGTRPAVNLEDFGGGALEEFDVARSDALFVLRQSLGHFLVASEQHERVSSGSAVGLMNEQYPVLTIQHTHRRAALLEERQLPTVQRHPTSTPVLNTSHPTQNGSFQKRSFRSISWLSAEKLNLPQQTQACFRSKIYVL